MSKTIILLFITLVIQSIQAQQTDFVTQDKFKYYEEYSVLSADKTIKHGPYFKLNRSIRSGIAFESVGNYSNGKKNGLWEIYYDYSNNIKERGYYCNDVKDSVWIYYYSEGSKKNIEKQQTDEGGVLQITDANPIISGTGKYKNGEKTGIWEYFNEKAELCKKYNYDDHTLIYSDTISLENREARFLDGDSLLNINLVEIFDLDGLMNRIHNKMSLKTGKLRLKFTIDENGAVKDIIEIENTIRKKKYTERAIETLNRLSGRWYPKIINNIPQAVEKVIAFDIVVTQDCNTSFDEKYNVLISSGMTIVQQIKIE